MPGQSVALTNERTGTCPLARIRGRPRSSLAQIACVFVAAVIKQLQGSVVFKFQEEQHSKTAGLAVLRSAPLQSTYNHHQRMHASASAAFG